MLVAHLGAEVACIIIMVGIRIFQSHYGQFVYEIWANDMQMEAN